MQDLDEVVEVGEAHALDVRERRLPVRRDLDEGLGFGV
jgi:hypothetical protein